MSTDDPTQHTTPPNTDEPTQGTAPPNVDVPTQSTAPGKKVSTADKLKFAGLIAFLVLVAVVSVFVVRFITTMGEGTIETQLEQAIVRAGAFGVVICLALQFVQVVVAFIPGEVVQIVIGYVYGTLWGGLITLVGALISSVFVFYLVRKLGTPFVASMIGGKDNRLLRFFADERRRNATVFILYLIPGLPKDVFNYLVPLTKMRPAQFFVLSTIARSPAIFASTFVAAAFKQGNYLAMAIVAVIFGGLGVVGIVFNQQIMNGVDAALSRLHRGLGRGAPRHDEVYELGKDVEQDVEKDAEQGQGADQDQGVSASQPQSANQSANQSQDASQSASQPQGANQSANQSQSKSEEKEA
ncbi:MAG: VTT domain-containing protein [Coriobacteriales bacterium]|nr:VTT domain-containing protein [Coriobacteriales bacterium]